MTLLPVWRRGWPATISRKRCSPSRRCSMTSSVNLLVNTFPGRGGMLTRVLSFSRMSRNASKSEYRLRTTECCTLNDGMLVWGQCETMLTHHNNDLVIRVHLPSDT